MRLCQRSKEDKISGGWIKRNCGLWLRWRRDDIGMGMDMREGCLREIKPEI